VGLRTGFLLVILWIKTITVGAIARQFGCPGSVRALFSGRSECDPVPDRVSSTIPDSLTQTQHHKVTNSGSGWFEFGALQKERKCRES
jgi:hypothetical protein